MVVITVLLAATTASFFLDFGGTMTRPGVPAISFENSPDVGGGSDELAIEVTGGPAIESDRFHVVVSDATCGGTDWDYRFTPTALGVTSTKLMAGTELPVTRSAVCGRSETPSGPLYLSSAQVDVVWVGEDGSHSQRLYRWEGPDA